MDALWKLGSGTVADVAASLKQKRAYTTILTTLRTLERKGYVHHEEDGRVFVYAPAVEREAARRHVLDHVTTAFFGGSPRALMLHLAEGGPWDERVARRLRDLLGETGT